MTKLVDNGEILKLDNESISNEPFPKRLIFCKSIEEKMIEFRKKNHEKYLQYKGYSTKTLDKDESFLSPICISETDINDNVTSDKSESVYGQRVLYASLVIQLSHVCNQVCWRQC